LHEQVNDPSVLLQEEFGWQLLLPCEAHSLISGIIIDIRGISSEEQSNHDRILMILKNVTTIDANSTNLHK
jgi:hypothetical protein